MSMYKHTHNVEHIHMHSSSIMKASPLSAKYLYHWNHNNDTITKRRVSTNPEDYKYKSPNVFTPNALLCLHVPTPLNEFDAGGQYRGG